MCISSSTCMNSFSSLATVKSQRRGQASGFILFKMTFQPIKIA